MGNYTPSAAGALEGVYPLPDDGDTADAASVDVPMETLARDLARALGRKRVQVAPSRFLVHAEPRPDAGVASVWLPTSGLTYYQSSVTPANNGGNDYDLAFPLEIPDQANLTAVTADFTPVIHGTVPATFPSLKVVEFDPVALTSSTLVTVNDLGLLAAYNVRHQINIAQGNMPGGNAIAADRGNKILYVIFVGEFGANSILGLVLNYVKVFFNTSNEDPGAG
jgi:hypothetical protein